MKYSIAVIDGTNLIFRCFFGGPYLTTRDGIPTGAVYTALKSFRAIVNHLKPDYLVVVWDSGKKNFRHEQDKTYKANRPSAPDDLKLQFSILQEAFNILDVPQVVAPDGYECDDAIGTIAKQASEADFDVIIVSSDKDFYQLCDDNIRILRPTKFEMVTKDTILQEYGIEPEKMILLKALCGDKSDNIKGVKGIGPKGAIQLIQKYQTLRKLINYAEENLDTKYGQLIAETKEELKNSHDLVEIKTNIEIGKPPIRHVSKLKVDEEKFKLFCSHYELETIKTSLNSWLYLFNYKSNKMVFAAK